MNIRIPGFALVIIALLATALACAPKDNPPENAGANNRSGRVIVPQTDWEPAGGNQSTGQGEPVSGDGTQTSTGGETSGAVGTGVIVAGTINIALLINGTEHPLDRPIYVHDNEQVECLFKVTATGSELRFYEIDNAARVSIKQQGQLTGMEATIPYRFTYVRQNWGDGGVRIAVGNAQGSVEIRQVLVFPAPIPGGR
jgi:hypothetical protein